VNTNLLNTQKEQEFRSYSKKNSIPTMKYFKIVAILCNTLIYRKHENERDSNTSKMQEIFSFSVTLILIAKYFLVFDQFLKLTKKEAKGGSKSYILQIEYC
jgi:hypothetical protein